MINLLKLPKLSVPKVCLAFWIHKSGCLHCRVRLRSTDLKKASCHAYNSSMEIFSLPSFREEQQFMKQVLFVSRMFHTRLFVVLADTCCLVSPISTSSSTRSLPDSSNEIKKKPLVLREWMQTSTLLHSFSDDFRFFLISIGCCWQAIDHSYERHHSIQEK